MANKSRSDAGHAALFGRKNLSMPPIPVGTPLPQVLAPSIAPVAPAVEVHNFKSAADLLKREFHPIKYIIPDLLPEGCTLFAGKPKIGKSWTAVDWVIAVATGGTTFGQKVEQGDALYLALEDNERRLKSRLKKVAGPFADLSRLTYETEFCRVDEGAIQKIQGWINSRKNPRMIVIDVLARVRPLSAGRQNQYDADYNTIAELQKLAGENSVAIVVVHHTRKMAPESGDAVDKISGTLGLAGAADTLMVLDRAGSGTTLYLRGRDIEEAEKAVEFDRGACRWKLLGAAVEVRRSDERKAVLDAMRAAAGKSMTPSEVALATGMRSTNARALLFKMNRAGEIERAGNGYLPVDAGNAGNAGTIIHSLHPLSPLPGPLPPIPPR